ncbi:hypothetical protein EJ05DRAFT_505812 [Pseudovirgaria hyperparasitica]|uniref:Uncharacterized protein n=1 Tax=Pseudovirgaria hyperparasitica TaxID=470096 RepID=A0A6A6VRC1_9PEZI|nr:uncharacterized protein EJ05DRAFT_505812 [Pseudovirgaria hyperparasitica]KAF2752695.1 hypothetical protein EJ05DRAFT_505812 [Pseudovirgaria hyperparasitica]
MPEHLASFTLPQHVEELRAELAKAVEEQRQFQDSKLPGFWECLTPGYEDSAQKLALGIWKERPTLWGLLRPTKPQEGRFMINRTRDTYLVPIVVLQGSSHVSADNKNWSSFEPGIAIFCTSNSFSCVRGDVVFLVVQ